MISVAQVWKEVSQNYVKKKENWLIVWHFGITMFALVLKEYEQKMKLKKKNTKALTADAI